jgi:hypothetical protein
MILRFNCLLFTAKLDLTLTQVNCWNFRKWENMFLFLFLHLRKTCNQWEEFEINNQSDPIHQNSGLIYWKYTEISEINTLA